MKHFLVISRNTKKKSTLFDFQKIICVYRISKNEPNFLFDYEIDTQSFKGYESSAMNELAKRKYLPEKLKDEYYLFSTGNFRIHYLSWHLNKGLLKWVHLLYIVNVQMVII